MFVGDAPPSSPDAEQDKSDDEESAEDAKPPAKPASKPAVKDKGKDKGEPSKRKKGAQDLTNTVTVTIRVAGNLLEDVCHASIIGRACAVDAPKSKPNVSKLHKTTAKVGDKGPPKPLDVEDTTKTDATEDADAPNLQRFDCPFPGCSRKCLMKKGLAAHYGMMHGNLGAPKLDWKTITSYEIDPPPPKPKVPRPSFNQLDTDTCRSAPKRKPPSEDSHLIRYKCPFPGCEKRG